MKTTFPLILAMALNVLADIPEVIEGERGAHHRVWHRIVTETHEEGRVTTRTNQAYVEMATGMHYLDPDNGQWLESKEQFELLNGAAVARQGQHQVILLGNIAEDNAVDLLAPDDKRFQSNPRYLSFYDAATKQNVLIAEVKESVGQLIAPNVVLYDDCFDTIQGAIRFTYTRSAFEQDILLYENPGNPADHGLNPATTLIEIYTAFNTAPQPRKSSRRVASGLEDETLDFGVMEIGRGKAFALLDAGGADEVGVSKLWTAIENRQFLVESAPYLEMKPMLDPLPARQAKANGGKARDVQQARTKVHAGRAALVAASARARTDQKQAARSRAVQMAVRKEAITRPAVVIDYITLNASSQTNYTYKGDSTYFINGTVNLSATTTFEGRTVIKFSPTNSARLNITGTVVSESSDYAPIIMTARDDHSVGESIGSASLSGYATNSIGIKLSAAASGNTLKHLRFSYLDKALVFDTGGSSGQLNVAHAQFVKCRYPLTAVQSMCFMGCGAKIHLDNALAYDCNTFFQGDYGILRAQHLTVHQCGTLGSDSGNDCQINLTNTLLVTVTNWGNIASNLNATVKLDSDVGVFQTAGAGAHYLAANSTNRNAGTTNITASLLADLRLRTTYPPLVLSNTITMDTILSPQAQRDTDVPDLGWSYAPLDYVVNGITLTNSLLLTNAVAVGTFGPSTSYGILINPRGKLISEGTATALNRIARYNTVQEQATTNWSSSTVAPAVKTSSSSSPVPEARFRFTAWSLLGGSGYHVSASSSSSVGRFQDCQFGGAGFYSYKSALAVTNCFWERVYLTLDDHNQTTYRYFYNNLFRGGTFDMTVRNDTTWLLYDNFFDQTSIYGEQDGSTGNYNGYVTNYTRLYPNGANDKVLTNSPVYLTSTLGKFYYPTNDGMLSLLLNIGSRNATNAGLYHFTTTTNQVKEATTTVDIGFHYVAVTNGVPGDADGDGLPDYLEDYNGNGVFDSSAGETDWQTSENGTGSGSGMLQVFTVFE